MALHMIIDSFIPCCKSWWMTTSLHLEASQRPDRDEQDQFIFYFYVFGDVD